MCDENLFDEPLDDLESIEIDAAARRLLISAGLSRRDVENVLTPRSE